MPDMFILSVSFVKTLTAMIPISHFGFSHSTHLKFNPEIPWVPSEADINALQTYDNSELVICGIYIRLFIANPGTVLYPLKTLQCYFDNSQSQKVLFTNYKPHEKSKLNRG